MYKNGKHNTAFYCKKEGKKAVKKTYLPKINTKKRKFLKKTISCVQQKYKSTKYQKLKVYLM